MSITRRHVGQRMSQIVIHKGVVYLAGQVGNAGDSVAAQTRQCLERVDALLDEAGSGRDHLLKAVIWLADMADFDEMNSVWDEWVPAGCAPARACGESRLARPDFAVEITVTAAVKDDA
ncbi:MAG: RidA family protein [Proteobacteria bacterium]|nr:MAG: RidA family protein [Pseudomonadota bacterium]